MPESIIRVIGDPLWGNPDAMSVEHRSFNLVTLLVFSFALVITIINILSGNPFAQVILSTSAALTAFLVYSISLRTKRYELLTVPFSVVMLIILTADWLKGGGSMGRLTYFYSFFVIGFMVYLKGWVKAAFLAFMALLITSLFYLEAVHPGFISNPYNSAAHRSKDILFSFLACLFFCLLLVHVMMNQLRREREKLQAAIKQIQALRGILPVCAVCKKVRDDKGYWDQLESYFKEHGSIGFTHGLCPDCLKRIYNYEDKDEKPPEGAPK